MLTTITEYNSKSNKQSKYLQQEGTLHMLTLNLFVATASADPIL